MRKSTLKFPFVVAFLIALSVLPALTTAQSTPQAPTATPVPQQIIVVVTATPSAPPVPTTFWEENNTGIWMLLITAVISLFFGVLLKSTFEKLGDKLAQALSRLGSGWGFKRRYLLHLIEEHRTLNIRGLRDLGAKSKAVALERVYVSLQAQAEADLRHTPPALSVGEALARHRRLSILGGPGSGKTTLLAYLTLTYARKQTRERLGLRERYLPILVPLRQLKAVLGVPNGESTLPAYLTKGYTDSGMCPRERFFEKALRGGRCVVLLDGLDEVADEAERRQMAEWVDRLVTLYPNNRYIVTSRPPGYASAPLENDFAVLRVRDFADAEIRQFANNWCLAVELAALGEVQGRAAQREAQAAASRRAETAARDLVAAIAANGNIRKLAVNPLLLSIIALVQRQRPLPDRRVELYAECIDVLLGHWDKAKRLTATLTLDKKRAILQTLALDLHTANLREISRRDLERQIGKVLPFVSGHAEAAQTDAAEFVDEVRVRSGLLVEMGLDAYAFSHQTFQEYLAARALVDTEAGRGTILAHLDAEWWQEVVLLYVGMTDATPVVQALLKDGACDDRALLLAGRCVAEAVKLAPAARETVIARLEQAFATCTGTQFLELGKVLADIAGEDSVAFFLKLAHTEPERRVAALWALGEMGRQTNEALRERVLARLLGYFQEGAWEKEAGMALAHVWGVRAAHELRRLQIEDSAISELVRSTMIHVPAGAFLYQDEEKPKILPEFWVDRAPVTHADYKQFIDANPEHPVPYVDENWTRLYNWDRQARTYPPDKAGHPVVLVSWHDAQAYAQWAGKRLLTEAEWEKAARGTDGREYPWGDGFDKDKCNTNESGIGGTTPVGRYSPQGDSPYGCVDMAGNVWEWTASDWSSTDKDKVVRGGSWYYAVRLARSAHRYFYDFDSRHFNIGFRCGG